MAAHRAVKRRPEREERTGGAGLLQAAAAAARKEAGKAKARGQAKGREDHAAEELEGVELEAPSDVMRVLEVAIRAELRLPNSSRRNRTLGNLGGAAIRLLEASELEQRIAALERRAQLRRAR